MPVTTGDRRLSASRLPHIIAGYVYIYSWIIRANINARFGRYFGRGTALLLGLQLLVLLVEVVLHLVGREVPKQAPVIQLVFFLLVAVAIALKYQEWNDDGQEVYFAQAAAEIVRRLKDTTQPGDKEINDLLVLFWKAFERNGVINVNLALFDGAANGLRVQYVYPPEAEYDDKLVLPSGHGGSGTCFHDGCVVYIPSRHYRHAIVEDFDQPRIYSLVPDCYEKCEVERFKSILSVPLSAYGQTYGVLNFDSSKRNMFKIKDFAQASFFGFMMAQCLHETKLAGNP